MLTKVQEQLESRNTSDSLTNVLIPTSDGGWRDIYRAGWQPAGFNQQWGGSQWGAEMVDAATSVTHKFDVTTSYIEDDSTASVAQSAGTTYVSTGFKASESTSAQAIWVKLYKSGNPSNNLNLRILPDDGTGTKPTGNTPVTNGTATAQSGKVVTSKADGDWYRFVFPTPPALVAGTVYHIVLSSSGAVDGSNFWVWKRTTARRYPFGNFVQGDATPTWTAATTSAACFIVEPVTANKFLQTSGQFDSKIVGATSLHPCQLKALCQPLSEFFDGKQFTFLQRGNWPVSSTIADFVYGLDHDRIQIVTNASGFAVVNLWRQDRTLYTVTGTTSVVAGFHDVAVKARTYGDGADILELWVDGAVQGSTLTTQTFTMDAQFRELGTAWIGGGFPTTSAWTQDLQMATLPSAQSWTWTGSAVEASSMSIQGGRLLQNKTGFGSTENGYYTRTTALNNTTGWTVSFKVRVVNDPNTIGNGTVMVSISDGSKACFVSIHEYYLQFGETTGFGGSKGYFQSDFKSKDRVITICGKGSDAFVYVDGKLAIDMTGSLTTASGTNAINFGDLTTAAGENADAVWSYVKYSTAGMLIPTSANAGVTQETAYWSGNKTTHLPALWNAGIPKSLKTYLNLSNNYVEIVVKKEYRAGIVNQPSTTSGTPVLIADLEAFAIGSKIKVVSSPSIFNNTNATAAGISATIDGAPGTSTNRIYPAGGSYPGGIGYCVNDSVTHLGLHKTEGRFGASGGTTSAYDIFRQLSVEYLS